MADVVLHEYPALRERFFEIRREGLPVIYLIPKKRSTFYAVLRVGVGSYDRYYLERGRRYSVLPGCAHFLEHKLFANPDGSDEMERFGDLGADANAYTTGTSTCFLFNCRDNFPAALKELLTFVSKPYFTRENVEREKKIILQEAAMYADSPSYRLSTGTIRQLYANHPIRDEIVGTAASIKRITPAHLTRVYRAFYHVFNMQLFVCGDLFPDDLLSILSDVSLPTNGDASRVLPPADEPRCAPPTVRTYRRRVSKPLFAVSSGFPEPVGDISEQHRKLLAAGVVLTHLFGEAGSLFAELKEAGLLTDPLNRRIERNRGICYFSVTGKSDRPKKVYQMIRDRVREFVETGIPEEDVSRICRAQYAAYLSSFDDPEETAEAFSETIPEGIDPFAETLLVKNLNADFVNAVTRELFSPDRLNLTVVRGGKQDALESEEEE